MTRPQWIQLATVVVGLASRSLAALDGSRYLWYTSPATDWEDGALPVGCGRLAASFFGDGDEVVVLNEDTIWDGPYQDRTPTNAIPAVNESRQMLIAGDLSEAGPFILAEMTGSPAAERGYSYFGELTVGTGHDIGSADSYLRWLDTKMGNAGVQYEIDGVNYTREFIASFPSDVLAARFTASKKGALNLSAMFSRSQSVTSNTATVSSGVGAVTLVGNSGQAAQDNPITFTGQAQFVADGASLSASGDTLTITGATTVDIFFDAETSYRYDSQTAWESAMKSKLSAAVTLGFDEIKTKALADTNAIISRASIDLGSSPNGIADQSTPDRLNNVRTNGDTSDVELVTLIWNYGRHMLVASSRDTSAAIDMPANLVGKWNNVTSAAWGGKYTININLEMNYWSAGPTNLIDIQQPMHDLLGVALPRGQALAKAMYGCDGVVFHHNLEVWGDPAPTDNFTSSTMWPMGAAWLSQHLMDYYRFTGDKDFLQNTAYPFLTEVAKFYECYTFEFEGWQVTGPSLSAENTFLVPADESDPNSSVAMDISIAMDDQIMRDVMTSIIEAAGVLGIADDDDDVAAASAFLPKIRPPQIGSLGQILEWRQEYKEDQPGQRHLSPLYGLHPSHQFSPLVNQTLATAAGVLLDRRVAYGSGSTGWSRTWIVNQYSRLFRADDAWNHLWIWFNEYPTNSLWNTDHGSEFQIDGNFGITSGITEMLLQSQTGTVHILPALSMGNVTSGSATGLVARGNFVVDVEWADGSFKNATVTAAVGGQLKLRVGDGEDFSVNGDAYTGPIQTTAGAKYAITS